jgi:glucosamine--fructose-6-phosphate aminotransferase (isomerizing)
MTGRSPGQHLPGVSPQGKASDTLLAEIIGQPSAIRRAAEGLAEQVDALAAVAQRHEQRPIQFTGMGSSYYACHAPVTLLTGAARSAGMVYAAELLHFRLPALRPDSVQIVVSQSGRSAEVVALADALKRGVRPLLVSVTNGLDNPLAQGSDIALDIRAGPEKGPSTMTFAATLVVLAGVAQVLAGRQADEAVRDISETADRAEAAAETLLAGREELAERLAGWLGQRPAVILLGRGAGRAASATGALLLKEAARLPAEALESGQFRHGPLELAGPDLAAAVVVTEPATERIDLGIAADLVSAGASVLVVGRTSNAPAGSRRVPLTDVGRALTPALAAVPFQLLAWRLAQQRSRRPGSFTIGSKVTTRE